MLLQGEDAKFEDETWTGKKSKKRNTKVSRQFCVCDLFGMVKTWPFQRLRLRDLQLGIKRVTNWITWFFSSVFLVGVSFSFHTLGLREDDLQPWIYVFTDSTMVSHHEFHDHLGEYVFYFFHKHRTSKSKQGKGIYFVAGGSNYPPEV